MKGWRLLPESTFWDLPHDRAYRQRYAWYKRFLEAFLQRIL